MSPQIGKIELQTDGKFFVPIRGDPIKLGPMTSWSEDGRFYLYSDGQITPIDFLSHLSDINSENKMFLIETIDWYEKKKEEAIKKTYNMTPDNFEHLCAELYKEKGYKTIRVGEINTPDEEIDLIAENKEETIFIQVKRYTEKQVSNTSVSKLDSAVNNVPQFIKDDYDIHYADRGLFTTLKPPSDKAENRSQEVDIDIIYGDDFLYQIIKYNLV